MTRHRASPFRVVEVGEWHAWTGASLTPTSLAVLLYLRTGPLTTRLPGLAAASAEEIAADLGLVGADMSAALEQLAVAEFVQMDPRRRVAYLPGVIVRDLPDNANAAAGMARDLAAFPDCTAVASWLNELAGLPTSAACQRLVDAIQELQRQFATSWPDCWSDGCVNGRADSRADGRANSLPSPPNPNPTRTREPSDDGWAERGGRL